VFVEIDQLCLERGQLGLALTIERRESRVGGGELAFGCDAGGLRLLRLCRAQLPFDFQLLQIADQ
jgi:hypothetical protein